MTNLKKELIEISKPSPIKFLINLKNEIENGNIEKNEIPMWGSIQMERSNGKAYNYLKNMKNGAWKIENVI